LYKSKDNSVINIGRLGLLEDQSKKEEEKLYSYASESDQDEEEDDHYDMEFAEDAPVVQSAVVVPTYAENESWFPQEEKTKNLRQRRSSLTQSPRLQQSFASDAPQDIRSTVIRASHIQKEAPQQEMQAMFGFGAPKPASAPVTSTTSSVEITGGGGAPPPPMQAPVMSPPARPPAAKGGLPPQAPPSGDLKAEKQERKRKKIKDKAPILLLGRKESAQVVKAPPKPTVSRSESEKLSVFPSLKKARPITAKKIGKTLQRESVTSQSAPNVKQKEEEEIERVRQIMSENLSLSLDMEMQLRDSSNLYEYAPRYKAKRGFGFSLGGLFSGVSNLWKKVTTREPTRQTESAPTMGAYVPTETESGPISDGIVYDVAPASKVEPLVYPTAEGKVKFEKYKRIKRIGAGAQSTCILAKIGQEDVILKSFITSEEFNQEVGVLKRLQHKNIVGYIDSFSFLDADGDEKRYLVLEYCNQGDLSNLMKKYRKKKMPERLFVKVMLQILTGIDYIHENDHLHRDIKPKNLLMHNQVVKIGDFGFSSSVYDKTAVTGGSALYLSPEFVSNMYERKVDIWSIGCTAVEMVTHKERDMKLLLKQYKNANAVNETGHFLDSIWHEIHYSPWIKKALQNSLQEDHTKRISSKELLQCFTEHSSATTLQRVWRGYSARKRLRT
jgi:serine/threonine protein kinase